MKRTLQEWGNFTGLPTHQINENVAVVLSDDETFIKFVIPRDLWEKTPKEEG